MAIILCVWTVTIGGFSAWYTQDRKHVLSDMAHIYASACHDKDAIYRRWHATHEGVCISAAQGLKTSARPGASTGTPHVVPISPRDASALRHSEKYTDGPPIGLGEIAPHITSLKPLNPENVPDTWEQTALQSFEEGVAEAHTLVNENGAHFIRMMRPLYFDHYCVRCHEHQGYELGDVRGGVTMTVPIDSLWQAEAKQTSLVIAALASIWCLGVAAIGLGALAFQRVQLEQEQTLDELRTNEYKMRAILDQTFHFIGVLDTSGHVIDVNQTALAFAGVRSSAVLNKLLWETPWWTHDAAQQTRLREAIQLAASGETVRLEVTHLALDGGLHYVDFSLRPVRDEAGSVICLIPEGHDLTDRKLAERALCESERGIA